jgi:hypothetical protein
MQRVERAKLGGRELGRGLDRVVVDRKQRDRAQRVGPTRPPVSVSRSFGTL